MNILIYILLAISIAINVWNLWLVIPGLKDQLQFWQRKYWDEFYWNNHLENFKNPKKDE